MVYKTTDLQAENDELLSVLERHGYRRCDIAACNCNGWHGGHCAQRLTEIGDALVDAGIETNGKTLLTCVRELVQQTRDGNVQQLCTALQQLRREHYVCDDNWYSCPKVGGGDPTSLDHVCNCGADRVNAIIDEALNQTEN